MKARIVNLVSNEKRRQDIEEKLRRHPYLEYEFIEAVDGRILSEEEKDLRFDRKKFQSKYKREAKAGEIGCTLSHRKIWEEVAANNEAILVCEDDLVINRDLKKILEWTEKFLKSEKPRIVFLSDKFMYLRKKKIEGEDFYIAKPYGAETTCCYAINAAAARNLLKEKPFYVADAWSLHRRHANILSVIPIATTQEKLDIYGSEINSVTDPQLSFSFFTKVKFKVRHIIKTSLITLKILHSTY